MRFTQAYANSAVCSASRVALITGMYQYRLTIGLERGAPSVANFEHFDLLAPDGARTSTMSPSCAFISALATGDTQLT